MFVVIKCQIGLRFGYAIHNSVDLIWIKYLEWSCFETLYKWAEIDFDCENIRKINVLSMCNFIKCSAVNKFNPIV